MLLILPKRSRNNSSRPTPLLSPQWMEQKKKKKKIYQVSRVKFDAARRSPSLCICRTDIRPLITKQQPLPQSESPRPQPLKLPSPPTCAVVSDSIAPHSVSLGSGQISDSSIMKWVFFQTRCYFSVSFSLLLARTQYGRGTVVLPEFGDSPLTVPGDKAQKG